MSPGGGGPPHFIELIREWAMLTILLWIFSAAIVASVMTLIWLFDFRSQSGARLKTVLLLAALVLVASAVVWYGSLYMKQFMS